MEHHSSSNANKKAVTIGEYSNGRINGILIDNKKKGIPLIQGIPNRIPRCRYLRAKGAIAKRTHKPNDIASPNYFLVKSEFYY